MSIFSSNNIILQIPRKRMKQDTLFDSVVSHSLCLIFELILLLLVLRLIKFYVQNTAFGSVNSINMETDGNNNSESFFDDFWSFAEVGANATVFLDENLDMQLQKESEEKTKVGKSDAVSYILNFHLCVNCVVKMCRQFNLKITI